ncbi:hypothetical protein F4703DRAFT_1926732 [Phycomyces blakesleeanus]
MTITVATVAVVATIVVVKETLIKILPDHEIWVFEILLEYGVLVPLNDKFLVCTHPVNSVLTPLTACYSPGCLPTKTCYAPLCPHRPPGPLCLYPLQLTSIIDPLIDYPAHLKRAKSLLSNPQQFKQQAAIAELVASEQHYLADLHILHHTYAKPILEGLSGIEEMRRKKFHDITFGNHVRIASLHQHLYTDLTRQWDPDQKLFSGCVGTVLTKHLAGLVDPYVLYTSSHAKGAFVITAELHKNSAFTAFVSCQDNHLKTRRLGLRHYLTLPTLRMGRLRLLVQAILKHTTQPDHRLALEASLAGLHKLLETLNQVSGKATQQARILQLASALTVPAGTNARTHCLPDNPTLLHEGQLQLVKSVHSLGPIQVHLFLFAHGVLVTRRQVSPEDGYEEFTLVDAIPTKMLHVGPISLSRISSMLNTKPRRTGLFSSLRRRSGDGTLSRWSRFRTSLKRQKTAPASLVNHYTHTQTHTQSHSNDHDHDHQNQNQNQSVSAAIPQSDSRGLFGRARRLTLCHRAYPENSLRFMCSSVDEYKLWQTQLRLALVDQNKGPFVLKGLCDLPTSSNQPIIVNGASMFPTSCGKVWCTLGFQITGDSKPRIALGTQHGLWTGPCDGSEEFQLVLSHHDCQQMAMLDNQTMIIRSRRENKALYAYDVDKLANPRLRDQAGLVVKQSSVLCFGIGRHGSQTILCYLKYTRMGRVVAVVLVKTASTDAAMLPSFGWTKKTKEYGVSIKDPLSVLVDRGRLLIRSLTEGVECIVLDGKESERIILPPKQTNYSGSISSTKPSLRLEDPALMTIEYIPLAANGHGLICSGLTAWPVFYSHSQMKTRPMTDRLSAFHFESRATAVVLVYPYLVIFSHFVIEIRHLPTCELVQTIGGNQIRCVYSSPLQATGEDGTMHITMLHPDDRVTRVYQLSLAPL